MAKKILCTKDNTECLCWEKVIKLEGMNHDMGLKLDNLIKELNNLVDILKKLAFMLLSMGVAALGYLIVFWVKGG